ncbi:MAG TPA: condensation domain-containing protein, partial [Pyrinomonadaceae bacterium]|nr:condensation domain-containing protein [Pyrinomonadaceae bacterium]
MFEEIIEGFRLSPAQQRLWQQMNRYGASAFRSAVRISVRGPLDRNVLRRAWLQLANRHEVIRTTFSSAPGLDLPVQVVGVADEPALDLAMVCGEARDGWQVRVQEKGDLQSEVEVVTNAMLADRRTMQNLVAELARCYEAAFINRELEDEPAVQYADFSEWQHEMLESEEAERARQLWTGNSGRENGVLRLPDEPDSWGSTGYAPQSVTVEVSREVAEQLKETGAQLDASLEEILEAGWRILLWRLSGETDVTVARLFDGRRVKHLKSAFGLFAKYLPVPCRLAGTYRFSKIVRQLKDSVRTIAAQQDYLTPEDSYASWIGFDFESLQDTSESNGVSFSISQLYSCVECLKLRLSVQEANDRLRFDLHYDPA